jgi:Xaa-Pro aminopeptidase
VTRPAGSAADERIAAVSSALAAGEVVALVPGDNLVWLLGFTPIPDERLCVLLVSGEGTAFVVPSLNADQSREFLPAAVELFAWDDDEGFETALERGLERIAPRGVTRVDADALMRADHLLALQGRLGPGATYGTEDAVLGRLREVKSQDELELLKQSALTADRATKAALEACRAGISELDVAAAAAAELRAAGADEVAFTIVASGPNGALPHHHTGRRKLESGDVVVIDLGGRRAGYYSDITRIAFVGEPDPERAKVAAIVEAAVVAALEAAGPGVTAGDVDAAARDVIAVAGYGDRFVHRTGHGLGVSIHEPPWIMRGSSTVLTEGMVFSIEPGIYLLGSFGVRLEEIVHISSGGCEPFSELSRAPHIAAP